MGDYKTDQDRFFDNLRDIEAYREATNARIAAEIKTKIDTLAAKAVKLKINPSEADAREWVLKAMKQLGKLPSTYVYPE